MFSLNTGSSTLLSEIQEVADHLANRMVIDATNANANGGTATTTNADDEPSTSGQATVKKEEPVHEPNAYVAARNLQPQQSAAHHLGIEPAFNYPPVMALEVHLPGEQFVHFDVEYEAIDDNQPPTPAQQDNNGDAEAMDTGEAADAEHNNADYELMDFNYEIDY